MREGNVYRQPDIVTTEQYKASIDRLSEFAKRDLSEVTTPRDLGDVFDGIGHSLTVYLERSSSVVTTPDSMAGSTKYYREDDTVTLVAEKDGDLVRVEKYEKDGEYKCVNAIISIPVTSHVLEDDTYFQVQAPIKPGLHRTVNRFRIVHEPEPMQFYVTTMQGVVRDLIAHPIEPTTDERLQDIG